MKIPAEFAVSLTQGCPRGTRSSFDLYPWRNILYSTHATDTSNIIRFLGYSNFFVKSCIKT